MSPQRRVKVVSGEQSFKTHCMSAGNLLVAGPKQCTSHCVRYKPGHSPAVSGRFCWSTLPLTWGWGASAMLNLSCKLHPKACTWIRRAYNCSVLVFFVRRLCSHENEKGSLPLYLETFQTLHLYFPSHTGEDLSPRETSGCRNLCCFQSLIVWPTDLPRSWSLEMRLWFMPHVGCERAACELRAENARRAFRLFACTCAGQTALMLCIGHRHYCLITRSLVSLDASNASKKI